MNRNHRIAKNSRYVIYNVIQETQNISSNSKAFSHNSIKLKQPGTHLFHLFHKLLLRRPFPLFIVLRFYWYLYLQYHPSFFL